MINNKHALVSWLPTLFLLIILGGGLLLRTIKLETAPLGLQADEASFLINATALLETGRDEDNRRLPPYLHSLIDSKPALYSYLQVPFIALLGPTTAASRLPSVLIGTVSIFLCYVLAARVFKNKWLGVVTAFFVAVSPWHVMNSRATQEVILSFVFFVWNLIAFHSLVLQQVTPKSQKTRMLQFTSFAFSGILAMYSYHALKIVLLGFYSILAVASVLTKSLKTERRTLLLAAGIIFLGFVLTASAAITRFSAIGLLNDDLPKAQIFELTTETTGQLPLLLVRATYNKVVFYFHYWIQQYLAHFDLTFLFVDGGATKRFSVPYQGIFYLLDALLIAFGGYVLMVTKKYERLRFPMLLLLLLAPLPASLTTEEIPTSIRSFTLLVPMIALMTFGVAGFFEVRIQPLIRWCICAGFLVGYLWSVTFFTQQFFVAMPLLNTHARSRHYEVMAAYLAQPDNAGKSVTFTNDLREGYIYLWREGLVTTQEVQAQPLARYQQQYQLSRYIFHQSSCDRIEKFTTDLVVAPSTCRMVNKPLSSVFDAQFDDGTPGFTVFKNNNKPL